ncbi:MAG: Holliday junction branch migration protein RuvA [Lachnospiraceae bacterium]|nr:Holliday junction branch migration protein RuvA [Lachnospiraceae bacterium]
MYAYFNGDLTDIQKDSIIIEVSGIGYNIFMMPSDISALPLIGERVKVFTYTCVKEDELSLYGFLEKNELDIFKMLISVSGIGPKGAMSIISFMGVNDLTRAILLSDGKAISKAPGIGAKTAERIIIDLKDKVGKSFEESGDISAPSVRTGRDNSALGPEENDAILALTALGYSEKSARSAVTSAVADEKKKDPDAKTDSDTILKKALFYL